MHVVKRLAMSAILAAKGIPSMLASSPNPKAAPSPVDWHGLPLRGIDGKPLSPELFEGKPVLVVNTASRCGLTPQYAGLQALWQEYRAKGLVVLGIPSNDFGGQEPTPEPQVQSFCRLTYGVDFPLMAKQRVKGANAHPLYRWAAGQTGPAGVPRWNFHKLLIGPDGNLAEWFSSTTEPGSTRLLSAIDRLVAASGRSS